MHAPSESYDDIHQAALRYESAQRLWQEATTDPKSDDFYAHAVKGKGKGKKGDDKGKEKARRKKRRKERIQRIRMQRTKEKDVKMLLGPLTSVGTVVDSATMVVIARSQKVMVLGKETKDRIIVRRGSKRVKDKEVRTMQF